MSIGIQTYRNICMTRSLLSVVRLLRLKKTDSDCRKLQSHLYTLSSLLITASLFHPTLPLTFTHSSGATAVAFQRWACEEECRWRQLDLGPGLCDFIFSFFGSWRKTEQQHFKRAAGTAPRQQWCESLCCGVGRAFTHVWHRSTLPDWAGSGEMWIRCMPGLHARLGSHPVSTCQVYIPD